MRMVGELSESINRKNIGKFHIDKLSINQIPPLLLKQEWLDKQSQFTLDSCRRNLAPRNSERSDRISAVKRTRR
eukprot:snap_masked-scaffold_12-processed-gene-12.40-mRNA-1 protein AED:1.00 eAED:1.00 QI:0/-1/0/0/-1/1/1/0/73